MEQKSDSTCNNVAKLQNICNNSKFLFLFSETNNSSMVLPYPLSVLFKYLSYEHNEFFLKIIPIGCD